MKRIARSASLRIIAFVAVAVIFACHDSRALGQEAEAKKTNTEQDALQHAIARRDRLRRDLSRLIASTRSEETRRGLSPNRLADAAMRIRRLGYSLQEADAKVASLELEQARAINRIAPERTPTVTPRATVQLHFAPKELIRQQQRPLSCSYRTLDLRLRHADFSMIVEIRRQAEAEDDVPRKVQVRHVVKPSGVAKIDTDDVLQIPLDDNEDGKAFALVFCAFDPSKRLGITEIQWIGKDEVSYYSKLAGFAVDERRMRFLLETEASEGPSVSSDARAELQALPAADIKRAAGKRVREFVLQRLAESTLDTSRRFFYLTLLGNAGKAEDVDLLAPYIFLKGDVDSSYVWAASEAYLKLGDEAAKKRFIEYFFTKPLPRPRTEAERNAQGARLLRPYLAMLEVAPELEQQARVGEYLIEHSVLADFVLSNALAKGEQRFATLAIETYNRKDVDPSVRREAVIYAAGMLELDRERSDRERIERFLELVSKSEPKMRQQALGSLKRRRVSFQWTQ